MSNQFKPSGYQQRWFIDHMAVMSSYVTPVAPPTPIYGGFWDITRPNSTETLPPTAPHVIGEGAHVYKVKQLLPGATASDIVYNDPEEDLPTEVLIYRFNTVYNTGRSYPKIPILFYPDGYFDNVDIENPGTIPIAAPIGTVGIPVGQYVQEYTVVIAGAKMQHELGGLQMYVPLLEGLLGVTGASLFPVPEDPGVVVISITLDQNFKSVQTVYVNGRYIDTVLAPESQQPSPNGFDDEQVSGFLELMQYPCWGFQKMSIFTRAVTPEEAYEISIALLANLEAENVGAV